MRLNQQVNDVSCHARYSEHVMARLARKVAWGRDLSRNAMEGSAHEWEPIHRNAVVQRLSRRLKRPFLHSCSANGRCCTFTLSPPMVVCGATKVVPWPQTTARLQRRFNRLLTSCPEMIFAKDNFVSGTVVEELPIATERVLGNDGCLAATLGSCRLTAFGRFLYTSMVVGGGVAEAYDCRGVGWP